MMPAGVLMVIVGGLAVVVQAAGAISGTEPFASPITILWVIVLIGGLIVCSLQQIRETLISQHAGRMKVDDPSE